MIAKLDKAAPEKRPAYYARTIRPFPVDHVNGAFLAATRQTWKRICPLWLTLFQDTWELMDDSQPPTDQLPLAALLDMLDIKTINLGEWMNWPVSKRIGGREAVIPKRWSALMAAFRYRSGRNTSSPLMLRCCLKAVTTRVKCGT